MGWLCFGGPAGHDDGEWAVSRSTYLQTQALYSKARVLDVLQDDLDERCKDVEGRAVALDAATMRRLHRASLPPDDSLRASELLGKLAALDRARAEARAEAAELGGAIAGARQAQRNAEFATEKAAALAAAHGQALAASQRALRDAEAQQVQLGEMLQVALAQLGMALSPGGAAGGSSPSPLGGAAGWRAARSPLAPQPPSAPPASASPAEARGAAPTARHPRSAETPARRGSGGTGGGAGAMSPGDGSLSGFTVYSNGLAGSPAGATPCATPAAARWRDVAAAASGSPPGGSGGSAPPATPVDPAAHAQRLASLIIPHLDAEQLESLVRIGASMATPPLARMCAAVAELEQAAEPKAATAAAAAEAPAAEAPDAGAAAAEAPAFSPQSRLVHTVLADSHSQRFFSPFAAGASTVPAAAAAAPAAAAPREVRSAPSSPRAAVRAARPAASPPRAGGSLSARGPRAAAAAPPPRKSFFAPLAAAQLPGGAGGGLIKAVGRAPQPAAETVAAGKPPRLAVALPAARPESEADARRRRAAERLLAKAGERLPAEHRDGGWLGAALGALSPGSAKKRALRRAAAAADAARQAAA